MIGPDEASPWRRTFLAPAAAAGHDVVDSSSTIADQHADDDALIDHRRRHEGDRRFRGRVGREILEADGLAVGGMAQRRAAAARWCGGAGLEDVVKSTPSRP
jgi:hypothetical protein